MNLNETNYKLIDLKMYFLEFVDLKDTPLQVGGPLVYFTLVHIGNILKEVASVNYGVMV